MKDKTKGLLIDLAVYAVAFGAALLPFMFIKNVFAAAAVFMSVSTAFIFVFSTVLSDVSVYDPYWSVAPPATVFACAVKYGLWNANAFILLAVICIWSFRLTANWFITYKGIGHEDWRYAQYREKYPPFIFHIISFTGLHFVPTAVVYGGLTGVLFAIQRTDFSAISLIGAAVSLFAVGLEFVSDRAIHGFLKEHKGEKKTCDVSVWKYSRHPNYLGEILFWCGLYVYFALLCPDIWYAGLGFLSITVLLLAVSIPMMEKHNLERRGDYEAYRAKTSALLLLPNKNGKAYEVSAGAVVYTKTEDGIKYVIIESVGGVHGFPKGHIEPGETEKEAALREIREEVGLRVRLNDRFRVVKEHPLPRKTGVMKRVVYFLAEYEDQDIVYQKSEVANAGLYSFDEASRMFEYESDRLVLIKADECRRFRVFYRGFIRSFPKK